MITPILKEILKRLDNIEKTTPKLRTGVITSTSPLNVSLGGSTVSYTGVSNINSVALNDHVAVLVRDHDVLILGKIL